MTSELKEQFTTRYIIELYHDMLDVELLDKEIKNSIEQDLLNIIQESIDELENEKKIETLVDYVNEVKIIMKKIAAI